MSNEIVIKDEKITQRDMLSFITSIMYENNLVSTVLNSYNNLVKDGVGYIFQEIFNINKKILYPSSSVKNVIITVNHYELSIKFSNVVVKSPTYVNSITGLQEKLFPIISRQTKEPYSGAIVADIEINLKIVLKNKTERNKTVKLPAKILGYMPIMYGSNLCHTNNLTKEALIAIKEDPNDYPGYFIISGHEYIIVTNESTKYNSPHYHINTKVNEHVRCEFLSQPNNSAFENSSQLKITLFKSGLLYIELTSQIFKKISIPFYIFYRLFGMCSDLEIFKTIINYESDNYNSVFEILYTAMTTKDINFDAIKNKLDINEIKEYTSEKLMKTLEIVSANEYNSKQFINNELINNLDKSVLPHIGITSESRIKKLIFIGNLIYQLISTHLKILQPTDRDSYSKNKRVQPVGIALAKTLKSHINTSIILHLYAKFKKELNSNNDNMSEDFIKGIVKSSINPLFLSKALCQAITTNNDTITVRGKAINNNLKTVMVERKNLLHMLTSLRLIDTGGDISKAKQTNRADMLRRVHSTYYGYICPSGSSETGETVGTKKHLAITALISTNSTSHDIKEYILNDPEFININIGSNLSKIYINGDYIGNVENSFNMIKKYRELRRSNLQTIHYLTTMYIDVEHNNDIQIWTDSGRLYRPLIRVYNNLDEFDNECIEYYKKNKQFSNTKFHQYIKLTHKHISDFKSGKISMHDLLKEQIIEYVTSDEQVACLISPSINCLYDNENNYTKQYTHCDIEQAIFGIAALMSPHGNHTQPTRVTYETNHGRQSAGKFVSNWPDRFEKNKFLQFYTEHPLDYTITSKFTPPNSLNVIIAYTPYGGESQEDSAKINKASIDRGMFGGIIFKHELAVLTNEEILMTPNETDTESIKSNYNYSKLVNGKIKKYSTLEYGDVIIGKVVKNNNKGEKPYIDKSIPYKNKETMFVENVYEYRNENGNNVVVVKFRAMRLLTVGDKLSSRSGNKTIVSVVVNSVDMPYMEDGVCPDIIINPHSIPTRMTIGQMIETMVGKSCTLKCNLFDGTSFLPIDIDKLEQDLVNMKKRYNGKETLYNGETGVYLNNSVYVGPVTEQRLLKFIKDDEQIILANSAVNASTGQPIKGKHSGGKREGWMEICALQAHGANLNMYEKTHEDSAGRVQPICRNCGNVALSNMEKNIYKCYTCLDYADIELVRTTQASIYFIEKLKISGMNIKGKLEPRMY